MPSDSDTTDFPDRWLTDSAYEPKMLHARIIHHTRDGSSWLEYYGEFANLDVAKEYLGHEGWKYVGRRHSAYPTPAWFFEKDGVRMVLKEDESD